MVTSPARSADVNRRFVAPTRARHPLVRMYLFATSRAYTDFVDEIFGPGDHSPLGFYDPSSRIVVVNLERGAGNLRHELVHPLVGDDFPDVPTWVNEGSGALRHSAPGRGGASCFLVNYRLRDLQAAIRPALCPPRTSCCLRRR
jgi:hypothetical protein